MLLKVVKRTTKTPVMKYTDLSTEDSFRFAFHCDRCNAAVRSERYAFNTEGFGAPPSGKAREVLWLRQHDAAYARAGSDALTEFSVCPVCGQRVCGNCFRATDDGRGDMCLDCLEAERVKVKRSPVFRWPRLIKKRRELC